MCSGPCASGYYCPPGSVSSTAIVCPIGQFSTGNASAYSPCPAGTYGSTTGLTGAACSGNCSAGSFGSSTAQTTATCNGNCSAGRRTFTCQRVTVVDGSGCRGQQLTHACRVAPCCLWFVFVTLNDRVHVCVGLNVIDCSSVSVGTVFCCRVVVVHGVSVRKVWQLAVAADGRLQWTVSCRILLSRRLGECDSCDVSARTLQLVWCVVVRPVLGRTVRRYHGVVDEQLQWAVCRG